MLTVLVSLLSRLVRGSVWISVLVPVALLAGLGSILWQAPSPPPVPPRIELVDAVEQACVQVPAALPEPKIAGQRTLVLPLVNDHDRLVTDTLRRTLSEQGWYIAAEPGRVDHMKDEFWTKLGKSPQPVTDSTTASAKARAADAGYVVIGEVLETRIPKSPAAGGTGFARFRLQLVDAATARPVYKGTFRSRPPDDVTTLSVGASPASGGLLGSRHYIVAVILFAVLWPLALAPVMKRVLKAENNALSALSLLLIAGVPIALGVPWAFGEGAGAFVTTGFVVGALLSALWCVFVMSEIGKATTY